jgi:DTW domain-containing protein YfiP
MARSVVFRGTARCPRCQIAPRWCICAGARTVALPFEVGVLMHHGEAHKPTSTGNLIGRVVPDARRIIYHNQRLPRREDVCLEKTRGAECVEERAGHAGSVVRAEREEGVGRAARDERRESAGGAEIAGRVTWILHPRGEALDEIMRGEDVAAMLAGLQVLLIDGTWAQANEMLRHVDGWGRKVSLPAPPAAALAGGSRYWLRSQHQAGHFSTIEALMGLLDALGFARECAELRLQFELHVYACLLARGQKARAGEFLVNSPLRKELPGLVEQLGAGAMADAMT